MAKILGKGIWAKRYNVGLWTGKGCATPRRTRSAQRHREKKQWRQDQEMPYYWNPSADIHEDSEFDPEYPEWVARFVAYVEARIEKTSHE